MKTAIIHLFTRILFLFIFIYSPLFAEVNENNSTEYSTPEKLTLASELIFAEISNIPETIELLNKNSNFSSIANSLFNYREKALQFKKETGINLLSKDSLKKAGLDISRSAYMSVYYKRNKSSGNTIYIPVLNSKAFALNFVKLIKKLNKDDPEADLNPAVNKYKNFKVYQIQPDIFYTFINEYFIVTASGDNLKAIIDMHLEADSLSLSKNAHYIDYKNKKNSDTAEIFSIFLIPDSPKPEYQKEKTEDNISEDKKENSVIPSENISENLEKPEKKEVTLPVNYIAASLKGSPGNITIAVMTSTSKENEDAKQFADMIRTGLTGKEIKDEKITGYHFLSFDFFKLNNYCRENRQKAGICKLFKNILKSINLDQIQHEDNLFTCSQSFINIILRKSDTLGEMDHFLAFIPMKECEDIDDLMENITDNLEKKYPDDLSGEEKIDDINSFWFITDDNNKINILEYNNDLYVGNNIDFIKKALKSENFDLSEKKDNFYKDMDSSTFLFSNSKFDEESFLKALLIMMAFKEKPELSPIISRINNISLTGKKNKYDYKFKLQLNFIDNTKK